MLISYLLSWASQTASTVMPPMLQNRDKHNELVEVRRDCETSWVVMLRSSVREVIGPARRRIRRCVEVNEDSCGAVPGTGSGRGG